MIFIGVDEVGRGCWAGDMVVGFFWFLDPKLLKKLQKNVLWLRDSKKLSKIQREKASAALIEYTAKKQCGYHLERVSVREIEAYGIVGAHKKGMERGLMMLCKNLHHTGSLHISIDGNDRHIFSPLSGDPHIEYIIRGDAKIPEIQCAAILAKVYRDAEMRQLCQKFPEYGFSFHKGYGTSRHRMGLQKSGPCILHRMNFEPMKSGGYS